MTSFVYVLLLVGISVLALGAGIGVTYVVLQRRQGTGTHVLELKAQQTLSEAETQAKEKLLEAKEEAVNIRTAPDQEPRENLAQPQQLENRLLKHDKTPNP